MSTHKYNALPDIQGCQRDGEKPEFCFGVIADIQYSDSEDGAAFDGTNRYFRHSIEGLKMAVNEWNTGPEVKFIAQLGDIIDGRSVTQPGGQVAAMSAVQAVFDDCRCKDVRNLMGNHELYTFKREELDHSGIIAKQAYSSFSPYTGWRCICLDAFDISTMGWPADHPNCKEAFALLKKHNPNDCTINDGSVNWKQGLTGTEKRWVPFNGAVSKAQLAWLVSELEAGVSAAENIIILTHVPISPGAADDVALVWNFQEVLDCLHAYAENVVAVFAGHDHTGGYTQDAEGLHHVTFRSPLEAPPPSGCHGLVEVHEDALLVRGYGTQESRVLPFGSRGVKPH